GQRAWGGGEVDDADADGLAVGGDGHRPAQDGQSADASVVDGEIPEAVKLVEVARPYHVAEDDVVAVGIDAAVAGVDGDRSAGEGQVRQGFEGSAVEDQPVGGAAVAEVGG